MIIEDGVVAGNAYDKYASRNPIERWMVGNFMAAVRRLALSTGAKKALEVGCGEGEVARLLAGAGLHVRATDVSEKIIDVARAHPQKEGIDFAVASVETLKPAGHAAPLVVSIEVLEHLVDPEAALKTLASLARPWLLLSVPREPLWRALNLARGKYVKDLGNTPGHLNHWSTAAFRRLAARHVKIEAVCTPLPWTIVLGRVVQ